MVMPQNLPIMQKYLKVQFFKLNLQKQSGFTLVELTLGIVITLIVAGAIMIGVSQAKAGIRSMQIEEEAFDYLQGYTEKLKGKISSGIIPVPASKCNPECIEFDKDNQCIVEAREVCYAVRKKDTGSAIARSFEINTKISWMDNFGVIQKLDFETVHLLMKK